MTFDTIGVMQNAVTGIVLALAGCSFSGPTTGAPDNDRGLDAQIDDRDAAAADAPAALALCDPTRGDLVACFGFDSDPDDAVGAVGASVIEGAPTYVKGVEAEAIAFDGDDNLSVGPDSDLDVTSLTLDAWINVTAPDSGRAGIADVDGHFGIFVHPGGEVRCGVAGSATLSSLDTATTLSDGAWHHLACRHTPGRGRELFVDGDIVACSTDANAINTGPQPLMIGADSPDSSDRLIGAVDSLRIFDSELGAAALCAAAGQTGCQVLAAGCALP